MYNIQTDQYGLLVYSGDGGDSANRTCVVLTKTAWDGNAQANTGWFKATMEWLTHKWWPGLLRRNPDSTKWYSEWNRMSRDQTFPYLIACKEYKGYSYVFKYILGHFLRFFLFTTNTRNNGAIKGTPAYAWKFPDLTGPDFWAVEIRALPTLLGVLLYPLLLVCDIYTLFSAIYLRVYNTTQIDVINHVVMCIFCQRHLPTPFTWIMNKFVNNSSDLQNRLNRFFGDDPYQPKINEMMRSYVTEYFK